MKYIFTFLNLILFLFFTNHPSSAQVVPVQNDNIYSLSVGDVELQVDASLGARITSLKLNSNEYIKQGTDATQMGSTLWTSPQSAWNWPPLSTTDSKAYTASIEGNKMIFVSDVETGISGKRFRFIKTFWANENNNSISIRYSMVNTGTNSMSVSLWEITRVGPDGITFWKTGDKEPWGGTWGSSLVDKIWEESDYYWLEFDIANGSSNKFFSGIGETGWFAHAFSDNVVFIKSFEDVISDNYAPGEGEFEYYTGGTYIELENQGKYTSVPAGDTLNYDVTWHIQELPENITAEIGSTDMIDFVQQVVDTETTKVDDLTISDAKVFPNPVKDILTVDIQKGQGKKAVFSLSDISGRLVLTKEFSRNTQVDVSELPQGIFLYKIISDQKMSMGKLIKQ